jgi:hypothetical protein
VLTKADDFPIHQTPEPIAFAGTDRNFYDRYFFNGYSADGAMFLAAAFGVYPHHGIMDGALSFVLDGVEHSVHVSRQFRMERMDTQVGPFSIEVIEPLRRLRVKLDRNEHGLTADLLFTARSRPMEEPRFTRRIGAATFMDLTRLTQHGTWSGWVEIAGRRVTVDPSWRGARDRSWGVRPIASNPFGSNFQFYWLWAPLNFDDRTVLFDINEDAAGRAWHWNGMIAEVGEAEPEPMRAVSHSLRFKPGTRHAAAATLTLQPWRAAPITIALEPLWNFYMLGIGYGHPEWGHGAAKGEFAIGGGRLALAEVDERGRHHQHIQSLVRATMTGDGKTRIGLGAFEQLIVGPHAPSGFTQMLDMAP